jgi:hypothetical protein
MIFMKYQELIELRQQPQPEIRLWLLFESSIKLERKLVPELMLEIQHQPLPKIQLKGEKLTLEVPNEHCCASE